MSATQKILRGGAAIIGAAAVFLAAAGTPAFAEANDEAIQSGLIPFDGPLPEGVTLPEYAPVKGEMPLSTHLGLWELEISGAGASANTYEWVSETETLLIYTTETEKHWLDLAQRYLPAQDIQIVSALHPRASVDAVLERIVSSGGELADGSRIVTAIPEPDGSKITLGVDSPGTGSKTIPGTEIQKTLKSDVPLVVESAPDVEPALRNHAPSDAYWFAGAAMSTKHVDQRYSTCTTAFRVGQLNGGSAVGMLSAEHCGNGKPTNTWHYSNTNNPSNQTNATWLGDFQGAITSIGYQSDTALWTAGNLAKLYPLVLTGNNTDVSSLAAIQGATYPALGTDVCYSGAPSGRVCGNEVTVQAGVVCYSTTQCYSGVSYTSQNTGTPAAGKGDSGGPVYQTVGGKIMAAGVISGIVNASTSCTGDPGINGRVCSPLAIYAPLAAALGSGSGWGLSYYP